MESALISREDSRVMLSEPDHTSTPWDVEALLFNYQTRLDEFDFHRSLHRLRTSANITSGIYWYHLILGGRSLISQVCVMRPLVDGLLF